MKKIITLLFISQIFLSACTDLNLSPLSEGSSDNWYSDEDELNMAVNALYVDEFWPVDLDIHLDDGLTDDVIRRDALTPFTNGNLNGQNSVIIDRWTEAYTAIARANSIIESLDRAKGSIPEAVLLKFEAEAKFVRASQYAYLISHYGDVVYYTNTLNIEESFKLSRTDKNTILQNVYEDYDFAASYLPTTYGSSELKRATKGAALALKARIALYMGDWANASNAAKACMDLDVYQLYPDFSTLFLSKTKNSEEVIFALPRSTELGNALPWNFSVSRPVTRNAGGFNYYSPSWYLFCSFLCTDGLPIDESPLFDPRDPWKNRDPRCNATIVQPQTPWLGFMYQNHPDSVLCWNFKTGKYQTNYDSRGAAVATAQYASYNGLVYKKFIDEDWTDDRMANNDKFIIRYADVLLMYAEAKIEQGEIDQSVLDAMNMVRARAYGVNYTETSSYPAISTTDPTQLRRILRIERRMEFAWEGLRYMDLIRWRLAEKAFMKKSYGLIDIAQLRTNIVQKGLWFFPEVPPVDEDGIADFTSMESKGLIKVLAERSFDSSKGYLWPIPDKEILINNNLEQNPGY